MTKSWKVLLPGNILSDTAIYRNLSDYYDEKEAHPRGCASFFFRRRCSGIGVNGQKESSCLQRGSGGMDAYQFSRSFRMSFRKSVRTLAISDLS